MNEEALQAIRAELMAKYERKYEIARARAQCEVETVIRERDAYMDGIYAMFDAVQNSLRPDIANMGEWNGKASEHPPIPWEAD